MFADKIREKSERTMWVEYKDNFLLLLRHVTREELRKKVKRATTNTWDAKTHQQVEKVDEQKYAKELSDLIVDWKGLTPAVLQSMVDLREYPEEDAPYSPQDAEALVKHSYDFDIWLQTSVTNIDIFLAYEAAEVRKKSKEYSNGLSENGVDLPVTSA